jgi:hypothetical protein
LSEGPIRYVYKARLGFIVCLGALTACATSSVDQVKELGDGTYSVAVRSTALSDQTSAVGDAVRKAGEFCHAKGLKLQNVPSPGSNVVFRCVGSLEPSAAVPADDEGGH